MLFFCGCAPCGRFVDAIGAELASKADVYFLGSDGDARYFAKMHRLRNEVKADLDGSMARSIGIYVCPSFVIRPSFRVFGNGREITLQQIVTIRKLLEER